MIKILSKKTGARALVILLVIFLTLLIFSSAVSAAMLGDVNSDGAINILDVILVNNYVLGSSNLTDAQISLADVNRDVVVDIFDTVLIMQMATGLIYEFPTLPAPTLTLPANNVLVASTFVTFQWNEVSGATMYELEVMNSNTGIIVKEPVLSGGFTFTTQSGFPDNGTPFRWRVRAGNSDGWGAWSSYRNFVSGVAPAGQTTPPPSAPAPSSPSTPAISDTLGVPILTSPAANANVFGTAVTFRWNAASGATRYKLELYKAGATTPAWSQELGNVTTASFNGLQNDGAAYKWRVQAGNISSWSGVWSVEQTFSNGLLPAAPVLTSPASNETVNGSSISFRWNTPTGAEVDKYNLEIVRVRDGLVLENPILGSSTVSLQTGFPDDGTEYKWRVRAGSKDGWGPWSAYITFISGRLNAPILTYPANDANVATSRITFEWKPVAGATKYRLVVQDSSEKLFVDVTLTNVYASVQRDFPNDGTQYTWMVYAGNRDGNWSPAATRKFTNGSSIGIPVQSKPVANASVSPADASYSVDFSWIAASGATKYQLEVINVRDGSVFKNSEITTAPLTQKTEAGFADGEQYKWRIRAGEGTANWGTWSPYRDFIYYYATPALPAPILLSPASYATAASETVEFKWTAVTGSSSYELEVIKVVGGLPYYHDDEITGVTESVTFPNHSTQFMWRVRANENGAWSLYQYFTNGFWWRW